MGDEIEPRRNASTKEGARIVEAVLDACALLLERDGYDALNTNAVARVAGVSVGSLYQYFPSKHAIVAALARAIEARGRKLATARAQQVDLTDAGAVTASFVSIMLDPDLGTLAARRALLLEVPPSWIREATQATDGAVERILATVIQGLGDSLRAAPAGLLAFVAFHAVEGVVEEALLQRPAWLGEPAFQRELLRLAWAYARPERAEPGVPELALDPHVSATVTDATDAVRARLLREPSTRRAEEPRRAFARTDRGRATVDSILRAMVEVLAGVGWAEVSSRRVARRAGVSAATLYRYFPDLRGIVVELARRREARSLAALAPLLEAVDRDLDLLVRDVMEALIALAHDETEVRRVLLSEVPLGYLHVASTTVDDSLRALVSRQLVTRGLCSPDEAETLAFVVAHAAERVLDAAVLRRPDLLVHPALADELTEMVLRTLQDRAASGA